MNSKYSLAQIYMSGGIYEEVIDRFITINNLPKKDFPKRTIVVLLDHHALGKRMVSSVIFNLRGIF